MKSCWRLKVDTSNSTTNSTNSNATSSSIPVKISRRHYRSPCLIGARSVFRIYSHWLTSRLHSVATATSVRVRDGKRLVTDGPFAETREQLGGYYLIEAKDLDAIGIAERIPPACFGTIEIPPVMEAPSPSGRGLGESVAEQQQKKP